MLSPAKKIKKSSSSSSKKQHSKRIFSEEDELKILEAVREKIQEDCPVPAKAAVVIFNDIQNKITTQAITTTQLGEKIRKLRDKYSKETDEEEALNPHQQKLSSLCKKIWRGIKKNTPMKQKMLKDDDDMISNMKEDDFVKNYPYLMEEVSKAPNKFLSSIDTLRYLDGSMLQQLNERWRKQHLMELQNTLKRMDLTKKHLKLVLNAYKSSSSKGKDDDVADEEAMDVDDADDELVGANDAKKEQTEDVDEKEEAEVKVDVESDDENEESEDDDEEEEAEVKAESESDDE